MAGADRLGGRKTLKVSGFLEEFEKDAVKRRVDIVALFAFFGVELVRKGKSYTGLCPWHSDKTPSLSVDRDKGLYHCFGCGESGDVVSLVEKMKGVGFREALEILQSYAGSLSSLPASPSAPSSAPAEPQGAPPAAASREALSLEVVAGHYHKRLYGHRSALAYLRKRGLEDLELLGRYGVGVADGSLLGMISNGQRGQLKELGVLSSSGREHFSGCLTVPLHDGQGQVVGLYGRAMDERRRVKHLYLKGPHRGLFNRNAVRVYEEVILTEGILDALSLIDLGFPNVQALYGTNGFTAEHLQALNAERVKSVVLALDADEAGRKASEKLAEKLVGEGFAIKRIEPPWGKDWNEALTSGLGADEIRRLIEQAPVSSPAREPAGLELRREGPRILATSGTVRYRLLGVKPLFVSSLRVNIRAEKEGATFLDNVDLYSARSRGAFSSACAHLLGVEAQRVENDLLSIVEELEQMRDRELEARGEAGPRELTAQERALGLDLLQSPELFERITADLETLGYVGEELNKLLLYLAASSRKMADPISVLILSQSASGKSLLVDTVRKLMPEEEVVAVSSLSDQALNYLPEGGLLHKFLILGESVHSEVVEHQIREMLSAHELSRLVTMKDPKTGELSTRTIKSPVVVAAVMSSTRSEINPENASRAFLINADESVQQTRRIHAMQKQKYSLARHRDRLKRIPKIIAAHQAAQRLLRPRLIVNPYAERLSFPHTLMRTRRDHERFIDLIAAVCFLRQFQKAERQQLDPAGGEEELRYIECDLTDYRVAYRILTGILPATISSFPRGALLLYEDLRQLIQRKAEIEGLKPEQVSVSQREVREATGHHQMFVKRYLRLLADYEYIRCAGEGRRGSRHSYHLVADEPIRLLDLSMIPTPEQMDQGDSDG